MYECMHVCVGVCIHLLAVTYNSLAVHHMSDAWTELN